MAEPGFTEEETEIEVDEQAILRAQQAEAQAQQERDAGLTDMLILNELMREDDDPDLSAEDPTIVETQVYDGDDEAIKPRLEESHARALAQHGGVEGLIEHRQEQFDQAIADGRMNEAVAEKLIDLLSEAGDDSAAYAEARFNSNAFFIEQADVLGLDPDAVNDITVVTQTLDPSAELLGQQQEATLAQERSEESAAALRRDEALREDGQVSPIDSGELANFSSFMGAISFTGEALDADKLIELGVEPRRIEILRQFGVIKADSGTDSTPPTNDDVTPPDSDLEGGAPEQEVQVADNDAETVNPTIATIEPDAIDVSGTSGVEVGADATVEEPDVSIDLDVEETVEVSSVDVEADKGYVTNPNGGPVTYEVSGVETGEPVRSEDGDLYSFADGSSLSDGFFSASDPDDTQIAMVDPFQDAMAALEKIGYTSDSNNMAFGSGTMSA